MILLIDNYDSFSYNLYQLIGDIEPDVRVVRNDELSIHDIEKLNPSQIIISPGPGRPIDAGICEEVIAHFAGKIPILGRKDTFQKRQCHRFKNLHILHMLQSSSNQSHDSLIFGNRI